MVVIRFLALSPHWVVAAVAIIFKPQITELLVVLAVGAVLALLLRGHNLVALLIKVIPAA
jgi:hypothetical protein